MGGFRWFSDCKINTSYNINLIWGSKVLFSPYFFLEMFEKTEISEKTEILEHLGIVEILENQKRSRNSIGSRNPGVERRSPGDSVFLQSVGWARMFSSMSSASETLLTLLNMNEFPAFVWRGRTLMTFCWI